MVLCWKNMKCHWTFHGKLNWLNSLRNFLDFNKFHEIAWSLIFFHILRTVFMSLQLIMTGKIFLMFMWTKNNLIKMTQKNLSSLNSKDQFLVQKQFQVWKAKSSRDSLKKKLCVCHVTDFENSVGLEPKAFFRIDTVGSNPTDF